MKRKYYFIKYTITNPISKTVENTSCVSCKHPLEFIKFFNSFTSRWDLVDWKEISEEEYEIGKNSIGIG